MCRSTQRRVDVDCAVLYVLRLLWLVRWLAAVRAAGFAVRAAGFSCPVRGSAAACLGAQAMS